MTVKVGLSDSESVVRNGQFVSQPFTRSFLHVALPRSGSARVLPHFMPKAQVPPVRPSRSLSTCDDRNLDVNINNPISFNDDELVR